MTEILVLDRLRKRFGGLIATDDVSLTVATGEIHALIGPNGAGKTTLVAQISGGLRPDGGTIRFRDSDITRLSVHQRARRGLSRSFQIPSLFENWTVGENLLAAAIASDASVFAIGHRLAQRRDLHDHAAAIAGRVDLTARFDTPIRHLSHGERRLLEIGLALVIGPKLILLDEPLAGVGPGETGLVTGLIQRLKQEMGVLLVEHDMQAVFALADRITVLVGGKVIASGPPSVIRNDADVRAAYLGDEMPTSGAVG